MGNKELEGVAPASQAPGHSAEPEPASAVSSADAASTPNADDLAKAAAASLSPMLFEPLIKRAVDDIYCALLDSVQAYLVENAHWNIRSQIEAANERAINLYSALLAIRDFRPDPADCDASIPDSPYMVMARSCKEIARAAVGGYWRPASVDRSGEADETALAGSAVGESAVTAKPADAQGHAR